jgi:hypothetical protein
MCIVSEVKIVSILLQWSTTYHKLSDNVHSCIVSLRAQSGPALRHILNSPVIQSVDTVYMCVPPSRKYGMYIQMSWIRLTSYIL